MKAEVQRLRKAASSGGGGSSDAMARFREGMEQIAKTGKVDAASLGLSEDDTVMLQLCQELLRFALDYEMGVNMLRAEMSVGNTSAMDTQMLRGLQQQVRKRFREALDQKEGAMAELRQSLNAGAKFIVELNTAYNHALSTGSKEMLGAIDPQEILEKHKRMLGHDFERRSRRSCECTATWHSSAATRCGSASSTSASERRSKAEASGTGSRSVAINAATPLDGSVSNPPPDCRIR